MKTLIITWTATGLLLAVLFLSGCKLTSAEVEPALPPGPVNGSATLVYRVNGTPVVANNSVNIGTILVAFLGGSRSVAAKLTADSILFIQGSDINNQPDRYPSHNLSLAVAKFRGPATYPAGTAGRYASYQTLYQVVTYDSAGHPLDHAKQYPTADTLNQVIITEWQPASRHLQGTFVLHVAGPNNPQKPTEISEGHFDVVVD